LRFLGILWEFSDSGFRFPITIITLQTSFKPLFLRGGGGGGGGVKSFSRADSEWQVGKLLRGLTIIHVSYCPYPPPPNSCGTYIYEKMTSTGMKKHEDKDTGDRKKRGDR
jgi:hypothetical protein